MPHSSGRYKGIFVVLISLTIGFGVCALFYYFQIERNQSHLNQLHFRELKFIANTIDRNIEQLLSAVDGSRQKTNLSGALSESLKQAQVLEIDTPVEEIDRVYLGGTASQFGNQFLAFSLLKCEPYEPEPVKPVTVSEECQDIQRRNLLAQTEANTKAVVALPFVELLGSKIRQHPTVMVMDSNKRVLAQLDNTTIDTSLSAVAIKSLQRVFMQIDLKGRKDQAKFAGAAKERMPGLSGYQDVSIAGENYRIYYMPYANQKLAFEGHQQMPADWLYLVGIKSKKDIVTEKLKVPESYLGFLIIFFVMCLAFFPLLKVRFISPSQALSGSDRYLSTIGLMLFFIMLSVLITNLYFYYHERKAIENQSVRIARQINQSFRQELGQIMLGMSQLIESKQRQLRGRDCGTDFEKCLFEQPGELDKSPYWLENVFLAEATDNSEDLKGQLKKVLWASTFFFRVEMKNNMKTMIPINVANRNYFKQAYNCNLWQLPSPMLPDDSFVDLDNSSCPGIFLERIFNYRDNRLGTQISFNASAVELFDSEGERLEGVMSVGTKFRSLFNPVLPPGFRFLIFSNDTGIVQFHSDNSRVLSENIFLETDNDPELVRRIFKANPNMPVFTTYYQGKKQLFALLPALDGAVPWSLVVMYDLSFHQSITLITNTTIVVGLLLVFAIAMLVLWLLLCLVRVAQASIKDMLVRTCFSRLVFSESRTYQYALGYIAFCLVVCVLPTLVIIHGICESHTKMLTTIYQTKYKDDIASAYLQIATYRERVLHNQKYNERAAKLDQNTIDQYFPMIYFGSRCEPSSSCAEGGYDSQIKLSEIRQRSGPEPGTAPARWHILSNLYDLYLQFFGIKLFSEFDELGFDSYGNALGLTSSQYLKIKPFFIKEWRGIHSWSNYLFVFLLCALALLAFFVIIRDWLIKRVLGMHISDYFRRNTQDNKSVRNGSHLLLIRPTRNFMQQTVLMPEDGVCLLGDGVLDLCKEFFEGFGDTHTKVQARIQNYTQSVKELQAPETGRYRFVLSGIELFVFNARVRQVILEALQELVAIEGLQVILVCEVSPLYRLTRQAAYPNNHEVSEYANTNEQYAWYELLRRFEKQYVWNPDNKTALTNRFDCVDVLTHESLGWPELEGLNRQFWEFHFRHKVQPGMDSKQQTAQVIKASYHFPNVCYSHEKSLKRHWCPQQITEFFSGSASSLYRMRWELCTKQERLLLIQMASGMHPNPSNTVPLEHLVRRGYLYRCGGWFIMNESFRHFVLAAEDEAVVNKWLAESRESVWRYFRLPLFAFLLATLAMVLYSMTDAVETVIAVMTGILGLIPLAISNLNLLRGSNSSGS